MFQFRTLSALGARWAVALILTAACASQPTSSSTGRPQPVSTPAASQAEGSPSPTQLPSSPEIVPSDQVLPEFRCGDVSSSPGARTALTAVRVAAHDSYDRVVFEFAGALPGYTVLSQPTATFIKDPSGLPAGLAGSAGLRVVMTPANSYPSYRGPVHLAPELAAVREAEQIGDFEAVNSWGIGLSRSTCMRVFTLSQPSRLVIDIQH